VNGKNRMEPMRLRTGRVLAACLISAGSAAWGLVGGLPGIALAASAAGSQCEPLSAAPAGSSASPSSPSSPQAELCVSVQASQSGIKRGQAAAFTVQVSAQNGSASGVSVTLAAAPTGQAATFTGRCPGGNGSATCTIGSLATSVSPAAYQLQAQIPIASTATSVTSVTLTATADAAASPAMATMPAASQTVTVAAAASASPSPTKTQASTAPASSPVAQVSPVSSPGLATVLPPVTLVPTPANVSTSLFSPANVASALPEITPVPVVPTPVTGTPASPVADTSAPAAGNFTLALNMSAATAQAFGLIIVALALTLAATKLVADYFTPRKNADAKAAKKPAHGKTGNSGTGARARFFRRAWPHASPAGQPPAPPQQQVLGKVPENTS
jgi:hypothetical protein